MSVPLNADNLRVLLVADDPLARAGLAALLSDQPRCTVVGQFVGNDRLPAEAAMTRPDVVLWDLGWDPEATLETALDQLADLSAGLSAVVLLPSETYAAEVWGAGVRGLLFRDVDAESLVAALSAVVQGLAVIDPVLAASIFPSGDRPPAEPLLEELTPRELEVLQLLADGLTNRAIADRLQISEHTVKFHVNTILGKLGAQGRTEAVVRAIRQGLVLL